MTRSTDAVGQAGQRLRLLGRRHEPAEHADADGVGREAGSERLEVLLGEHGGRHQDRHLAAVLDGLEGGPQGDLGLAVADVAHDQAVHRLLGLQVGLDLGDGAQLVGRLLVGEGGLQLLLPGRVRSEGVAARVGTGAVELQELARQVGDGPLDARLGPLPLPAAKAAQDGLLAAGIAADAVDLLDGHPHPVGAREVQLQEVALLVCRRHRPDRRTRPA